MLWVFYVFVCGALVKMGKISFIKIQKCVFADSFGKHLTITYSFVKLAIGQMLFRKKLDYC